MEKLILMMAILKEILSVIKSIIELQKEKSFGKEKRS